MVGTAAALQRVAVDHKKSQLIEIATDGGIRGGLATLNGRLYRIAGAMRMLESAMSDVADNNRDFNA